MDSRPIPRLGTEVSVIGLGSARYGGGRGAVDEDLALATVAAAVDAGVTLIDTADDSGDGVGERIVGRYLAAHPLTRVVVATRMGQRAAPGAYDLDHFRTWTDRSRANLGVDVLDLVHLHCPPREVCRRDAVFDALDVLVDEKRTTGYGVSARTCEDALAAIARPHVATVEVVLNPLRPKAIEEVLPAAAAAGVAVLARVPLASGLLCGEYHEGTAFADGDPRCAARREDDDGETFAGVDFATGLAAVRALEQAVPPGVPMAQFALRWIIDQPGVTSALPGARTPAQARANATAADLRPLHVDAQARIVDVYDELVRPQVHHRW
ncbi:oxidoreductase [Pilimelia terevasa]|uniref:Oxidoreductase n=1 Tax=Pilimelia terevasa TaxID=53372 RepID=A0A8J3FGQ1_9ACTN|nr:aldo/keto reductase [Pilimelia terevasa]GGK25659.1 oxidoreductase [Pilimelia terevasa]